LEERYGFLVGGKRVAGRVSFEFGLKPGLKRFACAEANGG